MHGETFRLFEEHAVRLLTEYAGSGIAHDLRISPPTVFRYGDGVTVAVHLSRDELIQHGYMWGVELDLHLSGRKSLGAERGLFVSNNYDRAFNTGNRVNLDYPPVPETHDLSVHSYTRLVGISVPTEEALGSAEVTAEVLFRLDQLYARVLSERAELIRSIRSVHPGAP